MARLNSVSFAYALGSKRLPVFEDFSLEFPEGRISAIVGPSGCGKTTLLRLLAGLVQPDSGNVDLASADKAASPSIIFQDFGLLPWATVEDNAGLGLRARGATRRERAARVLPVLRELGLADFSKVFPARLSGGMRQRVAIARALVSESPLLVMDEPFSSLDAMTRESLQDMLLQTQRRHGTTIVLVTHSIEEAAYLADRVYVLSGSAPTELKETFDTSARIGRSAPPAASLPLSRTMADAPEGIPASYRGSGFYFSDVAALRRIVETVSSRNEASGRHGPFKAAEGASPLRSLGARLARMLGAAAVLVAAWALASAALAKPFLPSPSAAFSTFAARVADGTMAYHAAASIRRIFLALAIAGPLAWTLGLAAGRLKTADTLASPIVYLLHPLPKVAFLPLLMLFLGLGDASKVALIGLVVFGQLFVGARDSAKAIPDSLMESVRALRGPRWMMARHALLPATLGSLFSSLRVSLGTAIAVLFLSETFASVEGLGWYVMDAWSRVDYPDMYASIIGLSLLGLGLYLILDFLEAGAMRWRNTGD